MLNEKHGNNYDIPRLMLWSRMICSNTHDDTDNIPNIPAFSSSAAKKLRKDSLVKAIEGAAVTFANTVSRTNGSPKCDQLPVSSSSTSPGVIYA